MGTLRRTVRMLLGVGALLSLVACSRDPMKGHDLAAVIGTQFVRADGTPAPADALKGKTVGLYFSAHWCPPCRLITPLVVQAYDAWRKQGKAFEIVLVDFDETEPEMRNYMAELKMNWLAIPFADEARRFATAEHWKVPGYPTLVIVSPDGRTVTVDGVDDILEKADAALTRWTQPSP